VRCSGYSAQRRGKTTTIRMITTLLSAPRGAISVFGVDVASRRMAVRRLIGYVPQQLSADATLTGRENVALLPGSRVPRRNRAARVADVLAEVDLSELPIGRRRPTPAAWCAAWSSRRRWSARPGCSCSTNRPSASTRWPGPASGHGSSRSSRPPG